MNTKLILTLAGISLAPVFASAAESKTPPPAKETAGADDYPLKTCVVSGETLGSMGEFVTYTHREPGKPDRVVRFCCEGCIEDFRQNTEKFLKKLDAAKAEAAKAPKADAKKNKS